MLKEACRYVPFLGLPSCSFFSSYFLSFKKWPLFSSQLEMSALITILLLSHVLSFSMVLSFVLESFTQRYQICAGGRNF